MFKNLDVLFLGGLFPKEVETEIFENSIGNLQQAANNLQWEIVRGLDANIDTPLKILNSLYIGSYPKRYKRFKIETFNFSHNNKAKDINVGFCNLTGIKNISRYLSLKPYIKEWALLKKNSNKKIIIAYAMTSTFVSILQYAKTINNDIITCLIVPDLPQYMRLNNKSNFVYNALKNIEIGLIKSKLKYIDSYVFLTKHMANKFDIRAPFVVVEGVSTNSFENIEVDPPQKAEIKTVLYTGGLNEKYGVINLVDSFMQLPDENFRLVLCGSGDAEEYIKKISKRDNRILFYGLIKREEVLKLQKNATVLVNPRTNNEEYTKYSFPSKIMEYMSSGTPVIGYKLDGIEDEYFNYMYTVEDDSTLYNTLKSVLNKNEQELKCKGNLAKEFVLNNKNGLTQVKKILQMITHI